MASKHTISVGHLQQSQLIERANLNLACLNCAYAMLKRESITDALSILEENKATILREAMKLNRMSDAESEVTELHNKIRKLEAEYSLPKDDSRRRNSVTIIDEMAQTRREIDNLISEESLDVERLLKYIPADAVLIVPFFSSMGGAVLILHPSQSELSKQNILFMDEFSREEFHELLYGIDSGLGWMRNYFYARNRIEFDTYDSWFDAMDRLTHRMWKSFVGEIHTKIVQSYQDIQRIIIIPQGGLQNLPLHAAWHETEEGKRHLMDYYLVTYLPSMSALLNLHENQCDTESNSAFVIGVSDYGHKDHNLPHALQEANIVANCFHTSALTNTNVTKLGVLERISEANYLHFACHGHSSWYDSTSLSQLVLYGNETITLNEVVETFDLRQAKLVTLSACETGISDLRNVPDEFVGFPTGFMQAGANAVVSSLWTVDDRSTALLMSKVYQFLTDPENEFNIAQALHESQKWLRNATIEKIRGYYLSILDDREANAAIIELEGSPHDAPYRHPYYWASFTYYGI